MRLPRKFLIINIEDYSDAACMLLLIALTLFAISAVVIYFFVK